MLMLSVGELYVSGYWVVAFVVFGGATGREVRI